MTAAFSSTARRSWTQAQRPWPNTGETFDDEKKKIPDFRQLAMPVQTANRGKIVMLCILDIM